MKKIAFTLGVLALTASAAMAQQVVRLGTEGAYPPYNLINEKGEVDGFERELGDELCKRASLTCTWVTSDWDSIIPNLTGGNYDAILAGMSITDERKAVIAFSDNYIPPTASAYAALSSDVDVTKVTVSAQSSTIQASHVAATGATLLEFPTPDESVAALRNGESEAVLADKDFLVPIVSESNGAIVWVGEDVPLGNGIGVGLRQSDTELKATFDKAIAEMKADGSINTLIKKWFGEEAATF